MDNIKEFISQISLNKYYDKRNNSKINKKVYIGYINKQLYTGYDHKKTYTNKGSLERSMVEWLSERYIIEKMKGKFDYKLRGQIIEDIHNMMSQLIEEGIQTKVSKMTEDTREKMQETLQKLLNDSKGGVICIII